MIERVEETIPNITFDSKVVELTKWYQEKLKYRELNRKNKLSADSFASENDVNRRYYSSFMATEQSTEGDYSVYSNRRTTKNSDHSFKENQNPNIQAKAVVNGGNGDP